MPRALNFCTSQKELALLDDSLCQELAFKTEEDWDVESVRELPKYVSAYEAKGGGVDISCYDITADPSAAAIDRLRKAEQHPRLIIVSDATVSPLVYMKPSILPSALLLKPLTADAVTDCMRELVELYYRENGQESEKKFCVETKEGKSYYPYDNILYFEAREKKIFLNTAYEETAFYSTLDIIQTSLPPQFIRCHRGFIVNLHRVTKAALSQNLLFCGESVAVPLSRGCKPDVIAALEGAAHE